MNSNVQPYSARERVQSLVLFVAFLTQQMRSQLATFGSMQGSARVLILLRRWMRPRVSPMFVRVLWELKHWRMEQSLQRSRNKVREKLPSWHTNIHTRKQGMSAISYLTLTNIQPNWMHSMGCRKHATIEHCQQPWLSAIDENWSPPLLNSVFPNCCPRCTDHFP